MKYLTRKSLYRHIEKRKRVFLFLDYDGTLSPIIQDPKLAKVPPETKKIICRLSRRNNFLIGIISGRSLKDIRKRVGLKKIAYAGNHGLELAYGGEKISIELPRGKRKIFNQAKARIKKALKNIKGVIFEDKGIIFSVHYRKVAKKNQAKVIKIFKNTAKPFLKQKLFSVGRGKKVLELKPGFAFNKAAAINFFQKKFKKKKNDLAIFIGDDITDEDVFRRLKPPDFGVRIGKNKTSRASYFLKNPREVTLKLKDIGHFYYPLAFR